ncbi:MAG TPA: type III-A CRISPR-associated protein Cas10/Csm1 [Negativicutes bacterium]|nr:type III-A CRISPR-associated protein Cas10/Csm1 [Negativicutes bacterium]
MKSPEGELSAGWADQFDEAFAEACSILDIKLNEPLRLRALQSVFLDKNGQDAKPKWFEPSELEAGIINTPNKDSEPDVFSYCKSIEEAFPYPLVALERYGTFIATSANVSIPLYDLFKSVTALYDCIKSSNSKKQCLLIGCDFSGIQDTVYTITSKGALKTLRARSFMLELLCEHIIHEILALAGSDRHAVVYSGGGGFGLLLPNSEEIVRKIKNYRTLLNEWALDEFEGRLFIAIDALPFDKESLRSEATFRQLRQTQADNLDRLKRRKFIDQLEKLFTPSMPEQLKTRTECQITHRDDLFDTEMYDIKKPNRYRCMASVPVNEQESDDYLWVSESCYHQFMLGDQLIGAEHLYRYTSGVDRSKKDLCGTLVLPGIRGKVYYTVAEVADATPEAQWSINSWNGKNVLLYANYVRRHGDLSVYAQQQERESLMTEGRASIKKDDTATFEGLASSSCGADLIGALRMDVDNLGNLFSSIGSLATLSARSRMLNLFFKVYLNQISATRSVDILGKNGAQNDEWGKAGRNVSIVYAGGDDLFIVGAWDDTVELAFDIQKNFKEFSYGRPEGDGGISGGLTLHQPKFPLYQMAHLSAEAEAYAKHDDDGNGQPQKNRISLFYDHSKLRRKMRLVPLERTRYMLSMEWALADQFLLRLMQVYRRCSTVSQKVSERKRMEVDKFSFGTIEKWFSVIEKYQRSNQLYLPTMARVMRGIEKDFGKETDLFEELVTYLYTSEEDKKNWISHFHTALNWLAYLRRTA